MEFRPYYMAKEWLKNGHDVTIVAGNYSHLRKNNPEISCDFQEEDIDGIKYVWLLTGEYSGNGMARAMTMFRFCRKLNRHSARIAERYDPDVVISSSTYPLDSYPANKIAKLAGAKYIHEVHDMWPSTLYEIGGMSKLSPFVILMQLAENHAYRNCDALVSLLSEAKEYMVRHGLREDKFHCVRNGIVMDEWKQPSPLPDQHVNKLKEISERGSFIFGYVGGHALSNNIRLILNTAERMKNECVEFVLVGDGAEKQELVKIASERQLENVHFLPPIPKTAVPTLLGAYDVIFMGGIDSPLYRFGLCSNKMFDAMMAAKPVIFAINTPSSPVQEAGCAIYPKKNDADGVANAVRRAMTMSEGERLKLGNRGRKEVLEKYTYDKIGKEFEELFAKP